MKEKYFVGVDVGTGSVRAALVNDEGRVVTSATRTINVWQPGPPGLYEQSSHEIWQAVCSVVQSVTADVDKGDILGLGFDATCSLVVLTPDFKPLTVNNAGESHWNIIMWMDHRADQETSLINNTNHEVLKYVGGKMSLEMQMPKLLWLKKNLKSECWEKAGHFFDLPDFLTWKATGSLTRSLCSLVCKWGYLATETGNQGWSDDFLTQIGLQDLIDNNYAKIGGTVLAPGEQCGVLQEAVAVELGLKPGTVVAASIVDAHAGGLGTLGCMPAEIEEEVPLTSRLALICGTSSCHMAVSDKPCFVPGVWGPYYSAMVPGLWLNEGGQSASGKLLDYIVENHSSYSWIKAEADSKKTHVHGVLNDILDFLAGEQGKSVSHLTQDLHVWPDFHGNRSPIADSSLTGMYGTRHIINTLHANGHSIQWLYICGGLGKNPLFVQTHADVLGVPIILPETTESVALGAAILGACASKHFPNVQDAMKAMGGRGNVILPNDTTLEFHNKKYTVFLKMVEHQNMYKTIMAS